MGKKKGAVAAKARAKREAKAAKEQGPVDQQDLEDAILHPDGCRVHRGLQNLGNTCYMNSIVQCLNAAFPFSDELVACAQSSTGGMCSALCLAFRGVRGLDTTTAKGSSFNPKVLREKVVSNFPWFRGKEQHDAHEFLRTLLGGVSDEFESAGKSAASASGSKANGNTVQDLVVSNFGGRFCAATLCWDCCRLSLRMDPFSDLQLHLPSLAGQSTAAMGVSATAISGELDPPPEEPADDSGSDGERRKKKKGGKQKGGPAPKAAPKAKLGGVWGAAKDREESLENARLYLLSFWPRVLRRSGDLEEVPEEAVPEEQFEIELSRKRPDQPQWGFRWSEAKVEEQQFVLVSAAEDSPLDKWNIKRQCMGEQERVVCPGDRLLSVNELTDYKEMSRELRSVDKVVLVFARSKSAAAPKPSDLGPSCAESDGEAERQEKAKADKEQRRKDFCRRAEQVFEALPPELRELFGPEVPNKDPIDKLQLSRCLRHFSGAEAIEDEFKPSYACSKCGKEEKGKRTYASRRMMLCPGSLPPLLTLQLKRFRRYRNRFEKSVASISLPTTLDLSEYVLHEDQLERMKPFVEKGLEDVAARCAVQPSEEGSSSQSALRYELFALCVHQGTSMKGGHYVAYVNGGPTLDKEQWFGISDGNVWKCGRAEVLKAEAYVVFYRREGIGAAAAEAAAALAAADAADVDEEEAAETARALAAVAAAEEAEAAEAGSEGEGGET